MIKVLLFFPFTFGTIVLVEVFSVPNVSFGTEKEQTSSISGICFVSVSKHSVWKQKRKQFLSLKNIK
jgi:hypothetical protein